MNEPVHIQTQRMILREFTRDDAEPLYTLNTSDAHQIYESDPIESLDDFRKVVDWIIEQRTVEPRKFHYVVACLQDAEHTVIGSIHVTVHSYRHRQAEIGYTFSEAIWGQGYATEAARAMLEFAFIDLDMWRVYAGDIVHDNIASVRVAEKLGMRQEAHMRDAMYFKHRWWDTVTYAIRRPEWEMTL